jgi:hypothetical protein
MNKKSEVKKEKQIPIMDAEVFLEDNELSRFRDHKDSWYRIANPGTPENVHSVDLQDDSYIIVYTGRRGAGKTTVMTLHVIRAVVLYGMKVVSNYPIEFMLRRHRPNGKSYLQHVKSEPLDFYKLMCFDQEYQHCLICIDEAPDVISHMAALTWRNRLVAAFTRQLRKNYNSLFLGAQDFDLIDKSMRWQADIEVQCKDARRSLGDNCGLDRGEMIWVRFFDHSGQWTGQNTEDRYRMGVNPYVLQHKIFPRLMWGDATHEAVFDSWFQLDILESLRKVDLKLSSIKIGDRAGSPVGGNRYPVSDRVLKTALACIENILVSDDERKAVFQESFYDSMGGLGDADRNNLGKMLSLFNVERGRDNSNGKRWIGFEAFDIDGFRAHIDSKLVGEQELVEGS